MDAFAVVRLSELMCRTEGDPDVAIGLIDGPVVVDLPGLASNRIEPVGDRAVACRCLGDQPCLHGTFIAGMLTATRGCGAPAICPGCTLLVRPVFSDCMTNVGTTPVEVAQAIHDCIDAGARILNISAALTAPGFTVQPRLRGALDRAAQRGVIVIAAAGNEPTVASTALTGHPWPIPVAGYGETGMPVRLSTVGRSIGSRGLGAPAERITSLTPSGTSLTLDGTSFAAPFVTGAAALLWSLFSNAPAGHVKRALLGSARRSSVVPPLLDAEGAYDALERSANCVRQAI
jgi:Subtilase family